MAWNQSTGAAAKPQPKKPSALRGVIAGVAVVAAAVAVFFALSSKDEKPKAKVEKEPGRIKEVKPQVQKPQRENPVATKEVAKRSDKSLDSQAAALEGISNVQKPDPAKRPKTKVSFLTHPSDQAIAHVISLGYGFPIPDTPMASAEKMERDFEDSLKHPIVIDPDDSPKDKELKEKLIAIREEIQERRKEGMSVKDVLLEHKRINNENAEFRREALHQFQEIRQTQGDDVARAYMEKANVLLEQKGARKIEWPLTGKQRKAIHDARLRGENVIDL